MTIVAQLPLSTSINLAELFIENNIYILSMVGKISKLETKPIKVS